MSRLICLRLARVPYLDSRGAAWRLAGEASYEEDSHRTWRAGTALDVDQACYILAAILVATWDIRAGCRHRIALGCAAAGTASVAVLGAALASNPRLVHCNRLRMDSASSCAHPSGVVGIDPGNLGVADLASLSNLSAGAWMSGGVVTYSGLADVASCLVAWAA
jgi:hypothetical protein